MSGVLSIVPGGQSRAGAVERQDSKGILALPSLRLRPTFLSLHATTTFNHRQASFARRLHPDGDGSEEILERDRSALATRLRTAAAPRRTEAVEPQVWGTGRSFPAKLSLRAGRAPSLRPLSTDRRTPSGRMGRALTIRE